MNSSMDEAANSVVIRATYGSSRQAVKRGGRQSVDNFRSRFVPLVAGNVLPGSDRWADRSWAGVRRMIGSGMMGGLGQPRDTRIEFWSKPETWPEDSKDYVFAGRGLLDFAKRLFGDDWSDSVAAMNLSFALPERLHVHTERSEIERAISLLQKSGRRPGGLPITGCWQWSKNFQRKQSGRRPV